MAAAPQANSLAARRPATPAQLLLREWPPDDPTWAWQEPGAAALPATAAQRSSLLALQGQRWLPWPDAVPAPDPALETWLLRGGTLVLRLRRVDAGWLWVPASGTAWQVQP